MNSVYVYDDHKLLNFEGAKNILLDDDLLFRPELQNKSFYESLVDYTY